MKFIFVVIFSIFLMSCGHHHKAPKHHHHAYEKHCAYSVSHGDYKTEGRSEYSFDHGGITYYFSSKEKLNQFKSNLDNSIKKANVFWKDRGPRLK